jgi:hypothetical protein
VLLRFRWNLSAHSLLVGPDGRIVVAGSASGVDPMGIQPRQLALVRLPPDGSRDPTFGRNGFVAWSPPSRADTIWLDASPGLFVLQPGGRLLAAATVHERKTLAGPPQSRTGDVAVQRVVFVRFAHDGSVDQSFGQMGVAEELEGDSPFSPYVRAWARLPDGHLVALDTRWEAGSARSHPRPGGSPGPRLGRDDTPSRAT